MNQYCDTQFNKEHKSTVGVDYKFSTITINNKIIKLQIVCFLLYSVIIFSSIISSFILS